VLLETTVRKSILECYLCFYYLAYTSVFSEAEARTARTIKDIVLFVPTVVWLYSVLWVQMFAAPFMAKDIDSWTPSDWVRAVTIVAVEMAVFVFVLWVVSYFPSSDDDPFWY
jgi:hypothetical protein